MQNKRIKNGVATDIKQCIYYDNDGKICRYGFGECGTKGKYSYSSECGTVMYKSIEQYIEENGLHDRGNKAITTTQP